MGGYVPLFSADAIVPVSTPSEDNAMLDVSMALSGVTESSVKLLCPTPYSVVSCVDMGWPYRTVACV